MLENTAFELVNMLDIQEQVSIFSKAMLTYFTNMNLLAFRKLDNGNIESIHKRISVI